LISKSRNLQNWSPTSHTSPNASMPWWSPRADSLAKA